jgi:hypothetical protein
MNTGKSKLVKKSTATDCDNGAISIDSCGFVLTYTAATKAIIDSTIVIDCMIILFYETKSLKHISATYNKRFLSRSKSEL